MASTTLLSEPQQIYGQPQSLLSAPPQSGVRVSTPSVVKSSSVQIVNNIHQCSKIVIYIYLLFGLLALIMLIMEFAMDTNVDMFYFVIIGSIILSLSGAWGLLLYLLLYCVLCTPRIIFLIRHIQMGNCPNAN